jgi:multicomponent Na+:H+ antiporter subunit F
MTLPFPAIAIVIVILMLPPLYRVVKGPTLFDRIIAAGLMGTNGVLVLATIGFAYERIDMFIDLAIAYALLNFVGTIAIGKFLGRHKEETK